MKSFTFCRDVPSLVASEQIFDFFTAPKISSIKVEFFTNLVKTKFTEIYQYVVYRKQSNMYLTQINTS